MLLKRLPLAGTREARLDGLRDTGGRLSRAGGVSKGQDFQPKRDRFLYLHRKDSGRHCARRGGLTRRDGEDLAFGRRAFRCARVEIGRARLPPPPALMSFVVTALIGFLSVVAVCLGIVALNVLQQLVRRPSKSRARPSRDPCSPLHVVDQVKPRDHTLPPVVFHYVPVIGCAVACVPANERGESK